MDDRRKTKRYRFAPWSVCNITKKGEEMQSILQIIACFHLILPRICFFLLTVTVFKLATSLLMGLFFAYGKKRTG